jgi:hypothetical protein
MIVRLIALVFTLHTDLKWDLCTRLGAEQNNVTRLRLHYVRHTATVALRTSHTATVALRTSHTATVALRTSHGYGCTTYVTRLRLHYVQVVLRYRRRDDMLSQLLGALTT